MKVGNFIYYNIKELVAIRFIFWHTNKKSLQIPKGQSKSVYRTTQWPKEKVQKDKQLSTKHTYKTTDRVTRNPQKTGGELRCSGRVSSSCSTSVTRRVNLVPNPVICMNEESNRKCFTPSGTYPWSLVTQIFHNGQPSRGGDRKTFEMNVFHLL